MCLKNESGALMGKHLFVVSFLTLFMFIWIDVFRRWYFLFLRRRGMSVRSSNTMMRIFWVLLTMVFWYTLLQRGMPKEFSITHFAFALYIFSFYGMLRSFFRKNTPSDE